MERELPAATLVKPRPYLFRLVAAFGPAVTVSVAYMDPGNFAANLEAGAQFGFSLLWVLLASNFCAIFLQILSARLGMATGENLPENCASRFGRRTNLLLWGIAEAGALATNTAEFLGAALGFAMLFHLPLWIGALLTLLLTLGLLHGEENRHHRLQTATICLVAVIGIAYLLEMIWAHPPWESVGSGLIKPSLPPSSAFVALSMFGATVMPHAIYLHGELVRSRGNSPVAHRRERRFTLIAMNIAFLINASMVIVAATTFHTAAISPPGLQEAAVTLAPILGPAAGIAFATALLASGLSASMVGTVAGQIVMTGFTGWRIPLWLRQLITCLPAVAILMIGISPTTALVASQVALSFVLPGAIIPLLLLLAHHRKGQLQLSTPMLIAGWFLCTAVIAANLLLLTTLH
ncbi:MAG: Nramp family divalent metal transporter [Firmicutes bacterium]|nr:Nramp family divalent metal transporter [Bacillota bacterium]